MRCFISNIPPSNKLVTQYKAQLVDLINRLHIFSIREPVYLYYLLICAFFQETNFCGNTEKKLKERTKYLCKVLVEKYKDQIV